MKQIIKFFINNEIVANLLMVAIFIFGALSLLNMKTTYFPETESRLINIQVIYPGSSPVEIEEGVVSKIEENLKGITGVERITSVSSENSGNVKVEVLKGYETDIVLEDVKNAVNRVNSFPVGMEPIVIFKQENLGRAIDFALSGEVDLYALKAYSRKVEDDLLAIDGISKVSVTGFPEEEIEISFQESNLRKYNISFQEATLAIRNYNLEVTGGTLKTENEELLIRASNKKYTGKELSDIIIKTSSSGGVVRLHEVATISDKWVDVPTRTYLDKKPSVVIKVQNTLEEDMLSVTDKVKVFIDKFNKENTEVQATIISDSSIVLKQRIKLLQDNGLVGFLLVLIFLALFLNYRLAFWVALAIPICFAGMFIVASSIGVTINVISLFGMILVIGILVDDGIVIAESIYQNSEEGMQPMNASVDGTSTVISAVSSAVITTVIAFSAFFFLDGRIGDFFREMAIVVIFSLIFSLIEGIFILPAHVAHSKALLRGQNKNKMNHYLEKGLNWVRNTFYMPLLRKAIAFPFISIAIVVAGLLITVGAVNGGFIKTTFFPNIPRDNFSAEIKMPAGTREDITIEMINRVEEAAIRVNKNLADEYFGGKIEPIVKFQKDIGPATNIAKLDMTLIDGESLGNLTALDVMSQLRKEVGPMYEAESFTLFSGSPFGKPVSISLLGQNKEELSNAVEAVKKGLESIKDLKDIIDNNQEGLKEINVELKPEAYNLGFSIRDIVTQVRQGFFGAEVQRLQRGRDEVKVWVRYTESDRSNLSNLSEMRITNAAGLSVPLSQLANFSVERGIVNISHIDGQREIRVEADIASKQVSVRDITSDLKNELIPEILKNYPGVKVGFEGQEREQGKTINSVKKVMPIIFLLMLFVVILTFKSVSQSLILFATIPFAFIGVGLGHYLFDLQISLFSFLGVIALVGVMVNDGLVFIAAFNDKIKAGVRFEKAILETGASRFRPIILTSVTTIAGLAPLILEKSFQAQFLIPMAVSVAFGLIISTYLMLIIIPSLLIIINRIKGTALNLWEGEKFEPEIVEPAFVGRTQNVKIYLIAAIITLAAFFSLIYLSYFISGKIV